MKHRSVVFAFLALLLVQVSPALAQTNEVKLDAAQSKITTLPAMRARQGPNVKTKEVARLKLGTVVTAIARTSKNEVVDGRLGYWYRVNLPNGQAAWVFGGWLTSYEPGQRENLMREIYDEQDVDEKTPFADCEEIYDLVASYLDEVKVPNTRGEFELLKLLALGKCAAIIPDEKTGESPYQEWLKAHELEVIAQGLGGGYNVRTQLFWKLESRYHTLPIGDRIASEAVINTDPADCAYDTCDFLIYGPKHVKYLTLYPNGETSTDAVSELNRLITDDVIKTANSDSTETDDIELRKALASVRPVLEKTSSAGKAELLKKLDRIKPK